MKNTVIFASSTSLLRGSKRLAIHKASLFYFPAKGVFLPISGGLPLSSAKKHTARVSGLVDGGIWQAAFSSAYVNKSHYDFTHRNFTPGRPAPLPGAADHPRSQRQTRGKNRAGVNPPSPRIFGEIEAAKITIKGLFSVT